MRYAEVIGDPVAQSKSPLIHKFWLAQCKLEGDYRRTFVERGRLEEFLANRRLDPLWRGCNVTIPHKERAAALVDNLDKRARAIGAVNCIVPGPKGLTGSNTDVDGIAAALDGTALDGASAVIIGGGGGARADLRADGLHGHVEPFGSTGEAAFFRDDPEVVEVAEIQHENLTSEKPNLHSL